MKFGILYDFRNPAQWARPQEELYARTVDQAEVAEGLGYDSIWVTEHHFIDDGYLPSVMPLLAALAVRTHRVTVGSYVLLLPLHNPLRIAEDAAVVDALSGGRLVVGVGQGYREEELRAYGVPPKRRGAYLEEAVQVLGRCWSESPARFGGEVFRLGPVDVTPKPVQRPHPPIWIGARGERAVRRAARLAGGWMTAGATAAHYQVYLDELASAGKSRQDVVVSTYRNLYVAPTLEQAWDDVGEHLLYVYNNYRRWYTQRGDLAEDSSPLASEPREIPEGWAIIGTPDTCAEAIERYRQEVPIDHLICYMQFPGLPFQKAVRSMELFAAEVAPRFRSA